MIQVCIHTKFKYEKEAYERWKQRQMTWERVSKYTGMGLEKPELTWS